MTSQSIFIRVMSWIFRLSSAVILFQTLFFKFTGAAESIAPFTKLGMEPWARYGTGVVELLAALFLIIPKTISLGAALSLGVISGAIYFHLTKLGTESNGDKGLLFILACVVFFTSFATLIIERKQWLGWLGKK